MKTVSRMKSVGLIAAMAVCLSMTALAHFQMMLPSDEVIEGDESKKIDLQLIFTHPMEASHTMDMKKPAVFGVMTKKGKTDLVEEIKPYEFKHGKHGGKAWKLENYRLRGMGDFVFYVQPAPYWEPMEDKFITQCTKVVVNSQAAPTVWGDEVGETKAEIVPLQYPCGLYAGNVFQGVVLLDGKPQPDVEIEVETLNCGAFEGAFGPGPTLSAPTGCHVCQIIKTDKNGIFSFGIPRSGWWGFAALMDGPPIDGKDHEVGAVMWIKAYDFR